jgi:hypothetical protein
MSSDQIWSFIGKILAVVGGIAAFIKIIEWVSSPRHKLVAIVQNVLYYPRPIANKPREENYGREPSMWTVSVHNRGKKPCEETTLVLPGAQLVCISREGASEENRELKHGVIALGVINPMETIKINAWGGWWRPGWGDIRLSHNSGIGKLRILLPTGKFFHDVEAILRLDKYLTLFMVTSFLCFFGLLIFGIVQRLERSAKPENSNSHVTNAVPFNSLPSNTNDLMQKN